MFSIRILCATTLFILLCSGTASAITRDNHSSCYSGWNPGTYKYFCNLHDEGRVTAVRLFHDDWIDEMEINPGGYHVSMKIYDVYYTFWPYDEIAECEAGTPAIYRDIWACDYAPKSYFQNCDTCQGNIRKGILFCWLVEGNFDISSTDGVHSQAFAIQMENFLNNTNNLLYPAYTPQLAATVGSDVVYSKNAYCSNCP
jgi:hypothetical protein